MKHPRIGPLYFFVVWGPWGQQHRSTMTLEFYQRATAHEFDWGGTATEVWNDGRCRHGVPYKYICPACMRNP